eukprot:scaffold22199_cov118-Isochrysis_galbana.AAC.4
MARMRAAGAGVGDGLLVKAHGGVKVSDEEEWESRAREEGVGDAAEHKGDAHLRRVGGQGVQREGGVWLAAG